MSIMSESLTMSHFVPGANRYQHISHSSRPMDVGILVILLRPMASLMNGPHWDFTHDLLQAPHSFISHPGPGSQLTLRLYDESLNVKGFGIFNSKVSPVVAQLGDTEEQFNSLFITVSCVFGSSASCSRCSADHTSTEVINHVIRGRLLHDFLEGPIPTYLASWGIFNGVLISLSL